MKYVEEKIEAAAKSDEVIVNILKNVKTTTPPPSTTLLDWNGTILENSNDTFFDDVPTPEPTPELKMDFTVFVEPLTKSVGTEPVEGINLGSVHKSVVITRVSLSFIMGIMTYS